jgi:hypothetical protein
MQKSNPTSLQLYLMSDNPYNCADEIMRARVDLILESSNEREREEQAKEHATSAKWDPHTESATPSPMIDFPITH